MTAGRCELCGRPTDEHQRDFRFKLPDPVLGLAPDELDRRSWGNDFLLQVEGIGAFVRALLRVSLVGGDSVTFGLWLGIKPDELRTLWEIWNSPSYLGHEFEGWCANAIPPWKGHVLAAPVNARAEQQDELPRVVASTHEVIGSVLKQELPHDFFSDVLP